MIDQCALLFQLGVVQCVINYRALAVWRPRFPQFHCCVAPVRHPCTTVWEWDKLQNGRKWLFNNWIWIHAVSNECFQYISSCVSTGKQLHGQNTSSLQTQWLLTIGIIVIQCSAPKRNSAGDNCHSVLCKNVFSAQNCMNNSSLHVSQPRGLPLENTG